jgi:hypothetical protein
MNPPTLFERMQPHVHFNERCQEEEFERIQVLNPEGVARGFRGSSKQIFERLLLCWRKCWKQPLQPLDVLQDLVSAVDAGKDEEIITTLSGSHGTSVCLWYSNFHPLLG